MTRTFVDSGVLIAAARGTGAVSDAAMAILDDPDRTFVTSDFVRLEVLPKPRYEGRTDEVKFYEAFFAGVESRVRASAELTLQAENEGSRAGLSAIDALHVAAAKSVGADEIVTTEKPLKPLFRVTGVAVTTIRPGA